MQEKNRPKILHIISGYPWPLHNGNHIRRYHILRSLSNCGNLDLLAITRPSAKIPDEISSLCHRVIAFPMNAPKRRTSDKIDLYLILKVLRELSGWPLDDQRPGIKTFPPEVLEILKVNYDIVWIDRLSTSLILGYEGQNAVLDFDDIEHLKIKRELMVTEKSLLRKFRLLIYMRAWSIAEMAALKKFGHVIVCHEKDREYLAESNVVVIPNGIEVPENTSFTPGVPGRMIYVGTMSYPPNDDAVRYFIKDILPRIKLNCPEAHLVVVGANPSKQLKDLADGKLVQVLGKIDNVAPYLKKSALSVVPLRIGGGTRLKILESLAYKTPVVSTTVGAEGLELEHGNHILIADEPEAFADFCISLLKNKIQCIQLAEAGYERVLKQYSSETIETHIRNFVRSALAQKT